MQTSLVLDGLYAIGPGVAVFRSLSVLAAPQAVISPLLDLRCTGLC